MEIGNGYGVPGGGAYYGALKPDTLSSGKLMMEIRKYFIFFNIFIYLPLQISYLC